MYSTNSTCVGYSSSIMYLLYHDISQERETLVLFSVRGISIPELASSTSRQSRRAQLPLQVKCGVKSDQCLGKVQRLGDVLEPPSFSRILFSPPLERPHLRSAALQCSADSECVGTTVPGMLTSPRRKAQTKTCAGYIQPLAWEDQDFQTPKPSPQALSASTPQSGA